MNILFLSQIVPYPPHGGILQRGYNLLREIGKRNRIDLMAFVHPDILGTQEMLRESWRELGYFCENVEYFRLGAKRSRFHFCKMVVESVCKRAPFSVLAHRSEKLEKRISEILSSNRIDLIHVDTIALAQFVDKIVGAPRILTHHNIESKLMERRAAVEKNPLARIYLSLQAAKLRKYEREQCPRFDENIVMSEIDSKELKNIADGVRTKVVPTGVDLEYFYPQVVNEEPSVIYAGGMNMFANRDAVLYFLKAIWPEIKNRIPGIRFFAVGQDAPREIKKISKEDAQVEVTGYVADVRPYVGKSSVYVVPLRVGGGIRTKIFDAMAMGKAIVSTAIGCEGNEVTDGENILIAGDSKEFVEKTVYLLENKDERIRLGRAARELVESKYSWPGLGRRVQEVYEEAVVRKGKVIN